MQSSRSNKRDTLQDLELRLGPSDPPKGHMLARNCGRAFPNLITIDDDEDDDVIMYSQSPRSSSRAMQLFPISSSWVPIVTEEDLELRLGFGAHSRAAGHDAEGRGEPSQTWRCIKLYGNRFFLYTSLNGPYGEKAGDDFDEVWTGFFEQQEVQYRGGGCKAKMHDLHGYYEGGDIHFVWACVLQILHRQCHSGPEQVPRMPEGAHDEQYPPHLSSRSHFLTTVIPTL
ncbi:hypothetical protein BVC80_9101g238 [Macleaya cordata]|uniref:Uncharacterized protein n=1 Tax=Macleaya cordata TaxID=56857 RepID=A0A200QGS2_MACCD|nr:hypothetical protein BVC80_9101g238 [Macleaya cordata]